MTTRMFEGLFDGPDEPSDKAARIIDTVWSQLEKVGKGSAVLVLRHHETWSPGMQTHLLLAELRVHDLVVQFEAEWQGARHALPDPDPERGCVAGFAMYEASSGRVVDSVQVPNRTLACHIAWQLCVRTCPPARSTDSTGPVEVALAARWDTGRMKVERLLTQVAKVAVQRRDRLIALVDSKPKSDQPSGTTMAANPGHWMPELKALGYDQPAGELQRAEFALTLLTRIAAMRSISSLSQRSSRPGRRRPKPRGEGGGRTGRPPAGEGGES